MYVSTASISSSIDFAAVVAFPVPSSAFSAEPRTTGRSSPGKSYVFKVAYF